MFRRHFQFLFFLLILFCQASGFAQEQALDDLLDRLEKTGADTQRVNLLLDLSEKTFRSRPDTAIFYAEQARTLAESLGFSTGLAYALKNIGLAYYVQGDYVQALNYWQQSLEIFQEEGDLLGVANLQNNIGAVYFSKGVDHKALEYYLESLKASRELGDQLRIATALTNLGALYFNKVSTHDKALAYYLEALPLSEAVGDPAAIGTSSVNLGEIYLERDQVDSALLFFNKALDAYRITDGNEAYALVNIGKTYQKKGDFAKAIQYQQLAYEKAETKNAKLEMAQSLNSLADTYRETGDLQNALKHYQAAITIAEEMELFSELETAYGGLSETYFQLKDFEQAYSYRTLFDNVKDTLYNIGNAELMGRFQFESNMEGLEKEIELLKRDNQLKEAQIREDEITHRFLYATAIFLIILIGGISYQYWFAHKSNKLITEERNRSEQILLNILPEETAEELKVNGKVQAQKIDQVTVLFADFKGFTKFSEDYPPEELVKSIDYYFRHFDEIIERHHLEKIKTIGDAYMCAGGLPVPDPRHAVNAVRAGLEIAAFSKSVVLSPPEGILPFEVRIGLNTGPVVAGVVGIKKFQYDIWGPTVNVAATMETNSLPGRVNISESTYQLIRDLFDCTPRGEGEDKHGEKFSMYFVEVEAQISAIS